MAESNLKRYLPIFGMGFLFTIGIVIALLLSPIFLQMNARADFSQFGDADENSLIVVVIYMIGILIFTGIILVIGKRKKGKFLKYVIFGVVGITLIYTLFPIIGYAMHGPLLLNWDTYDKLDSQAEMIEVYDVDNDNTDEILIGTNDGKLFIVNSKNMEIEWEHENLGSYLIMISVVDLDSDGKNEILVLTPQRFVIFQHTSGNSYLEVYNNEGGNFSTFATGDADNDGEIEIYAGGWGDDIYRIEKVAGTSGTGSRFNTERLVSDIGIVHTILFWSPDSPSPVSEHPLLILGIHMQTELVYAGNGSKWEGTYIPAFRENWSLSFITTIEVDDETMKLANAGNDSSSSNNKILVAFYYDKVVRFLNYNDFEEVGMVAGIRETPSFTVCDAFEDIDGQELVIKRDNRMVVIYSDAGFWDRHLDIETFIIDFDDRGSGAASANLDSDPAKEVIIGTGSGFMYGELEIIEFSNVPCFAAFIIAAVLIMFLFYYPEWYVVDFSGILMGAGVCAIIGISIAVFPILAFLIVLAVYDAISVYKTKHMIDLADNVMSMRLPIVLVIPKTLKYSYLDQERLKKQLEKKEEREAMFMGLGDVIIPGTLVVSAFTFLPSAVVVGSITGNLLVALGTLIGAIVGFVLLMRFVLKGNPQAGLPLLNSGAIIGYLTTYYISYQEFTFGLSGIL